MCRERDFYYIDFSYLVITSKVVSPTRRLKCLPNINNTWKNPSFFESFYLLKLLILRHENKIYYFTHIVFNCDTKTFSS